MKRLEFYVVVVAVALAVMAIFYKQRHTEERTRRIQLEIENSQLKERLTFYGDPVL